MIQLLREKIILLIQTSHIVIASEAKQSSYKANTYGLLWTKVLAMTGGAKRVF